MAVVLEDMRVVGSCCRLVLEEQLLVWARSRRTRRRRGMAHRGLHCRRAWRLRWRAAVERGEMDEVRVWISMGDLEVGGRT